MKLQGLWCLISGHDWSRPWTEGVRRVELCERCYVVREHVFVAPKAKRLDALAIDGTVPVVFTVSPRVVEPEPVAEPVVDEVAERRAEIAATVRAKYGKVGAESKGVS